MSSSPAKQGERLTLLLVEDDPDHQMHFEATLNLMPRASRPWLHAVDTFGGALEALGQRPCDVVVLDLGLPDVADLESVERLARLHPLVPIVVLTASADPGLGLRAVRVGAQDYLQKARLNGETLQRALQYAVERKRLLVEKQRQGEALQAFVHSASHDLRAPLRRIASWMRIVEQDGLDGLNESQRDALERVAHQADVVQELVQKLLELGSLGAAQPTRGEVDLRAALDDALEALGPQVAQYVSAGELPAVLGDRRLLASVFQNLCQNAVKYTRDRAPAVRVEALQRAGWLEVSVVDNGIGMDEAQIERIFQPFVRCVSAAEFSGSGIGLATCRAIVEAHGGRIEARSAGAGGSTFCFTLPAAGTDASAAPAGNVAA